MDGNAWTCDVTVQVALLEPLGHKRVWVSPLSVITLYDPADVRGPVPNASVPVSAADVASGVDDLVQLEVDSDDTWLETELESLGGPQVLADPLQIDFTSGTGVNAAGRDMTHSQIIGHGDAGDYNDRQYEFVIPHLLREDIGGDSASAGPSGA